MSWLSGFPVTASHSGPLNRSRMQVWSRKSRTCGWLTVEHLFDQVVDDVAVVAGEGSDERGGLGTPPQRECRQLKGGDPAFGAALECCDVAGGELERSDVVEVGRDLGRG